MRLSQRTIDRVREMAADAIESDHPCSDAGCDIATALEHEFVGWAWHSLRGATEAQRCDALAWYWPRLFAAVLGSDPYRTNPDWSDWHAHHEQYGRKCDACESFTYAEDGWEPTVCANCHAPLAEHADA